MKNKRIPNLGNFRKGKHYSVITEFKKGCKAHNKKELGAKTQRIDKGGQIRNWIKIKEPNEWMPYYHFIWLKSGRKIPKGLCLHHKNHKPNDDRLANLMLVTRAEHLKLHNILQYRYGNK